MAHSSTNFVLLELMLVWVNLTASKLKISKSSTTVLVRYLFFTSLQITSDIQYKKC